MNSGDGHHPLEIDGLFVSYPGTNVLKGLALEVRPGEVYGLVGRNAAGKTTLLKTLMRCIM